MNIQLLNIAFNIYQLRMKNRTVIEQISILHTEMIISLKRCYRTDIKYTSRLFQKNF